MYSLINTSLAVEKESLGLYHESSRFLSGGRFSKYSDMDVSCFKVGDAIQYFVLDPWPLSEKRDSPIQVDPLG